MTDTSKNSLYTPHPRALSVLYADIESHAQQQRTVFVGTAGSINQRTNASGFRFYAHQYYDGDGKQRERYVAGPVGDAEAETKVAVLRDRISDTKELVPSLRLLGREGFNLVDRKTFATLAVLHNHKVFAAGGVLVGSHTYGVLLNRLGVRSAPYATEDIDIARGSELAFDSPPELGLLEMLRETGIAFFEVPGLDPRTPATSFEQRGRSRFAVDFLIPSPDESFPTLPVPELSAYAIGLPYLDYLLAETQFGALLAREGTCTVRVPLPERFAIHKLVVSQLRAGRGPKSEKDIDQACVLSAALGDLHPGALEEALAEVPERARKHVVKALRAAAPTLQANAPRAWEEFSSWASA